MDEKNGAFLKGKLAEASAMLSSVIANDINNPNLTFNGTNGKVVTIRSINGRKIAANLAEQKNNRYILSLADSGAIYVVNRLS